MTCCMRGIISSSCRLARRNTTRRLKASSAENFLACPTTRLAVSSNLRYAVTSFCLPFSLLSRLARAISSIRCLTLLVRSRKRVAAAPTTWLTFFMTRVSTRTPSLSSVLSVG